MVKKIIYYNRELTSLFVDLFNYMFGKINNCEDYFGFFFPFGIIVHILNRIFHLFRLNIFASNAVLVISK